MSQPMNKEEAFAFLRQNQPLPDDDGLTGDILEMLDDVRRFFLDNPDERVIPLFLNSFGNGDGMGVYQLIEDVITKHPLEVVVPHLARALRSKHRGVRYWNAQIAARFPHPDLIEPLASVVRIGDSDSRYEAISALEEIGSEGALIVLRDQLAIENDGGVRELLEATLLSARQKGESP